MDTPAAAPMEGRGLFATTIGLSNEPSTRSDTCIHCREDPHLEMDLTGTNLDWAPTPINHFEMDDPMDIEPSYTTRAPTAIEDNGTASFNLADGLGATLLTDAAFEHGPTGIFETAVEHDDTASGGAVNEYGGAAGLEPAVEHNGAAGSIAPAGQNTLTRASDDPSSSEEFNPHMIKYDLRPPALEQNSFTTTWIDNDETGNYDPREEQQKLRTKRVKTKAIGGSSGQSEDDTQVPKDGSSVVPQLCKTLVITLKIKGEARMTFAKKVSDFRIAAQKQEEDQTKGVYRLRKRKNETRPDQHAVDLTEVAVEVPVNFAGWPEVRGCFACAELGIHCSLIDNEREWPCKACIGDENKDGCLLITSPAKKRACQRCKKGKMACSYSYTQNHSRPCQQCSHANQSCVAGPVEKFIRTRIRYDRDWVANPLPNTTSKKRKLLGDCKECTQAGSKCLRPSGKDNNICMACIDSDLPCTNSDPPVFNVPNETVPLADKPADLASAEAGTRRAAHATPAPYVHGRLRRVQTSFAHPIGFNHEDVYGNDPCHFCDAPDLAVLGFGKVNAEVIDYADRDGFVETAGGHRANGTDKTLLCLMCTSIRVEMRMCEKHDMRLIPEGEKSSLSQDDVFIALNQSTLKDLTQLCAICPRPAIYECEATDDGSGEKCCRLKLCEPCSLTLIGQYDGDLQQMLAGVSDEPSDSRPFGFRADHEFLKADGPLTKYLRWLGQQRAMRARDTPKTQQLG